jgi:type II secretory pathway pseudopilin PulG
MSLVEMMVAVVVLGILSTAVVGIILQTQSQSVTNRARVAASNLAARELDLVRDEFRRTHEAPKQLADAGTQTNPHPLDGQPAGEPLVVDGTPYTVVRSVQWNVTGDGRSACDGGSLVTYPTLRVTVAVSWPHMGGVKPVTQSTAIAPEKGDGVQGTDAFVAVRVKNAKSEPNVGRTVAVTGGGTTKSATTDSEGCAVVQVTPAVSGTSYTAKVADGGYVDMSGTTNPSKAVGVLLRGQLNNNVTFTVYRPGTVTIRLVTSSGALVPAATANGAVVTLVASESSGGSASTQYTMTTSMISISNLWPTQYGAFFGTVPPGAGYASETLEPGGSVVLDAVLELAHVEVVDLPANLSSVVAVPSGGTSCTASGAVPFTSSADLLPGVWNLFAKGADVACSPGPANVTLSSGNNDTIDWDASRTRIKVTGAPSGTLWALDTGIVGPSALTSCPSSTWKSRAIKIDGARSGFVELPAGGWYVYVGDGGGACSAVPSVPAGSAYAKSLPYGQDTTLVWPVNSVSVQITGIENVTGTTTARRPFLYVSTTGNVSSLQCTATTVSQGGTALTSLGQPAAVNGSITTTLSQGTWYLIGNDQNSTATWSPRCKLAGTVVVGASSGPLSINYDTASPKSVGP